MARKKVNRKSVAARQPRPVRIHLEVPPEGCEISLANGKALGTFVMTDRGVTFRPVKKRRQTSRPEVSWDRLGQLMELG